MTVYVKKVGQLSTAVEGFAKTHGAKYCERIDQASGLLLAWLQYLQSSELTGVADDFIAGVKSALLEVAACTSLGLVRPALFSMRAQIDMALAWLYFKDHKVEWQLVCESGDGFKLKSDVLRYLDEHVDGFSARVAILKQARTRSQEDPYRLLSAHVHSQSSKAIPSVLDLKSAVGDSKLCDDCARLQFECSEYVSDILLSCFSSKWASLPGQIMDSTKSRLSGPQAKAFFAS